MKVPDVRQALAAALFAAAIGLLWLAFSREETVPARPPEPAAAPYQSRDWSAPHQAKLNISLFTYRDRNRNGRYDVGDLPMGSVVVKLERPAAQPLEHPSNINGFANFQMSWQRDDADISQAGVDYGFEVEVPPGWIVTSGNTRQMVSFRRLEGSVAGLVALSPPAPVGLAPVLTISGRVSAAAGEGGESVAKDTRLSAIDPRGRELAPPVDDSGAFTLDAEPGSWVLVAEYVPTGEVLRRELVVSDGPVRIATLQFGQEHPEPLPSLFTQDFDYLTRSPLGKIPGGMGGLDWDYLVAVDNQTYNGPGFVNVLRAGKNVGYNSSGHPVTITPAPDGRHFDFVGGWFGVAWPDAEGETLSVEAWRGGQSIAREELVLSYLGPVWFDADFRQIDRLTLSTAHYWQFIAEDMVFRTE